VQELAMNFSELIAQEEARFKKTTKNKKKSKKRK
jgi:hypothetical protein